MGHQLPEIVLFGRDSLSQAVLDKQFTCSKDVRGDAKCKPQKRWPDLQSTIPRPVVQSRPEASNVGQRASCSGSCLDQRECDLNAKCICASDRGTSAFRFSVVATGGTSIGGTIYRAIAVTLWPRQKLLTSLTMKGFGTSLSSNLPSWGSHACTYIASAAYAAVQAKRRGSTCFGGRCLLESDGTLDIAATAKTTDGDSTNFFDFSPFANMTNSEVENLIGKYEGLTNISSISNNSATTLFYNSHAPADETPVNSILSNPFPSTTLYEPVPVPSLDSSGHVLPDPGSSFLNCPCNCTYVSAGCCLTNTVWEDPSERVHMSPLPANATVICDESTGLWLPKVVNSGAQRTSSIWKGFDNLGKVPYIPPNPI